MMNQRDSPSNYNTDEKAKSFSANLKQIMDSALKLACVIVAAWDYFHNRDLQRFVLILMLGYIVIPHAANWSLPTLKALAPRAATLAKMIADLLDKLNRP